MTKQFSSGVLVCDHPDLDNVRKLDYGVIPMVLKMQRNGILIDRGYFINLSMYLQQEKDRLTEEIRRSTGHYINAGSPDQVADLLFNRLKLNPPPHLKLTKSRKRYTVDDESLSSIKGLHPVIPLIQEYTECHKLKSSYADVLPLMADASGRVHTTLRITRQVSGRISSSDPNLMAQPTRTDLGKRIRGGFIAPPGRKLGALDLSQIEMRVAADDAQCLNMIDTFLRDGDIHSETASRIFGLPIDKLDKMRHRYPAKRCGFGVLFGIEPEGLQDQIRIASDPRWTERERSEFVDYWTLEECAKVINGWFGANPEIRSAMYREHSRARRYGYVWDMWGRIRWIPEVMSVHRWIMEAGLRQSYSHRIQSGAQGIMKLIMAEIDYVINRDRLPVDPLIQIHDELLVELDESCGEEFMNMTSRVVSNSVRMSVPIRSGYALGQSWGELEK